MTSTVARCPLQPCGHHWCFIEELKGTLMEHLKIRDLVNLMIQYVPEDEKPRVVVFYYRNSFDDDSQKLYRQYAQLRKRFQSSACLRYFPEIVFRKQLLDDMKSPRCRLDPPPSDPVLTFRLHGDEKILGGCHSNPMELAENLLDLLRREYPK